MQPADTVCLHYSLCDTLPLPTFQALTRMYNQPTILQPNGKMVGAFYKNPIDCLWKTIKTEGVFALYKGMFAFLCRNIPSKRENILGSTAHFLRIAPHT
jgi:solute carrier family 25, member 34/35